MSHVGVWRRLKAAGWRWGGRRRRCARRVGSGFVGRRWWGAKAPTVGVRLKKAHDLVRVASGAAGCGVKPEWHCSVHRTYHGQYPPPLERKCEECWDGWKRVREAGVSRGREWA